MKTTARYFDGQSSASQQVTLDSESRFDSEIRFVPENGNAVVWLLTDLEFEQYGDCLELRNKKFSAEMLRINDLEFIRDFRSALERHHKIGLHDCMTGLGFKKMLAIAASIFALLVCAYIFLLPAAAEKAAVLLPETFDDYLGATFMNTFLYENDVDTAKTALLNEFADNLQLNNTRNLHFTVVKSSTVNAFALPDGNVVVFTGILDKMQNSSELAGLLGHEVTHINNRHSTKMLCRNLAGYLIVSAIFSDVNGIMAVLASNAENLHSLSFSRDFEREADEQGTEILIQNHINPRGMLQLFTRLEEEEKFIKIPEIISTHPLTAERKKGIENRIKSSDFQTVKNKKIDGIFRGLKK